MTIVAWDRTDYDRARYLTAKRKLVAILGGRCATCGMGDGLEFDHIDPSTKRFAIMARWNRGIDYLIPELRKCQLLCASCHLAKSTADRSVDHGGGNSGKRNCPCESCRLRKNAYMRQWKAHRRAA